MRWRPAKWWGWFLIPVVWPAMVLAHCAGLIAGICDVVTRAFPQDHE